MYTNPSNICKTLINLLEMNSMQINKVIRDFTSSKSLVVLEGMRATLPVDMYPSFEIEPTGADNVWATTRAQRPNYNFTCTLTVKVDNVKYGVDYICTVANAISEIMTSPNNLQMRILNETKWSPDGGLGDTYILDSLISNATYDATRDGSVRTAEFQWFATVHEPFPDSKFVIGDSVTPTVLRPKVITL